jgi:hypothetical protein
VPTYTYTYTTTSRIQAFKGFRLEDAAQVAATARLSHVLQQPYPQRYTKKSSHRVSEYAYKESGDDAELPLLRRCHPRSRRRT